MVTGGLVTGDWESISRVAKAASYWFLVGQKLAANGCDTKEINGKHRWYQGYKRVCHDW